MYWQLEQSTVVFAGLILGTDLKYDISERDLWPGLREQLSSERMSLQDDAFCRNIFGDVLCTSTIQEKIVYDLPYQPCDPHANSKVKLHSNQCIEHIVC